MCNDLTPSHAGSATTDDDDDDDEEEDDDDDDDDEDDDDDGGGGGRLVCRYRVSAVSYSAPASATVFAASLMALIGRSFISLRSGARARSNAEKHTKRADETKTYWCTLRRLGFLKIT